jgi:Zn finger protein HypA/HybF involved in hydrogenase expression
MKTYYIYMIIGIIGILFTLLVVAVGVGYYTNHAPEGYTEEEAREGGETFLFICTPIMIVPSVIFLFLGLRGRARFQAIEDVADILKAYRRIKLTDLARKMGKTELEAEKLVMKCIEENLIHGYMDRQAQEFFTKDAMHQMPDSKSGWKCSACGAYNDSVILPGETAKCGYCGKIEAPRGIRAPPQQRPQPQMPYREPAAITPLQPHQMAAPIYGSTNCNRCGTPMVFVSQYNKWYCNRCGTYA